MGRNTKVLHLISNNISGKSLKTILIVEIDMESRKCLLEGFESIGSWTILSEVPSPVSVVTGAVNEERAKLRMTITYWSHDLSLFVVFVLLIALRGQKTFVIARIFYLVYDGL